MKFTKNKILKLESVLFVSETVFTLKVYEKIYTTANIAFNISTRFVYATLRLRT